MTSDLTPKTFDFGKALHLLKNGRRVARLGWNGKGMFLFLVPGSTFKVNRPPLLGIYPEGTEVHYHAHIDMRTAQGYVVPWLASQADMLADDWEEVSAPAKAVIKESLTTDHAGDAHEIVERSPDARKILTRKSIAETMQPEEIVSYFRLFSPTHSSFELDFIAGVIEVKSWFTTAEKGHYLVVLRYKLFSVCEKNSEYMGTYLRFNGDGSEINVDPHIFPSEIAEMRRIIAVRANPMVPGVCMA